MTWLPCRCTSRSRRPCAPRSPGSSWMRSPWARRPTTPRWRGACPRPSPGASARTITFGFMFHTAVCRNKSVSVASHGSFVWIFCSRSLFGSTRISSPSVIESINEEIEDPLSKRDFPIHYAGPLQPLTVKPFHVKTAPEQSEWTPIEKREFFPLFTQEVHWISDAAAEKVTEEMLKEVIDVYFTETESVSLLDIPNKFVSVDSEGADAIMWVIILTLNKQWPVIGMHWIWVCASRRMCLSLYVFESDCSFNPQIFSLPRQREKQKVRWDLQQPNGQQ